MDVVNHLSLADAQLGYGFLLCRLLEFVVCHSVSHFVDSHHWHCGFLLGHLLSFLLGCLLWFCSIQQVSWPFDMFCDLWVCDHQTFGIGLRSLISDSLLLSSFCLTYHSLLPRLVFFEVWIWILSCFCPSGCKGTYLLLEIIYHQNITNLVSWTVTPMPFVDLSHSSEFILEPNLAFHRNLQNKTFILPPFRKSD